MDSLVFPNVPQVLWYFLEGIGIRSHLPNFQWRLFLYRPLLAKKRRCPDLCLKFARSPPLFF